MEHKQVRIKRKKTYTQNRSPQVFQTSEQREEPPLFDSSGDPDVIDEILAGYTSRQTIAGVVGRSVKRSEAAEISSEAFVRSFRQESGQ